MTTPKTAWCNELGRIVTTHEMWELLFGKDRSSKILTIKCPTPECPARLTPMYFRPFYSSHKAVFKIFNRDQHNETCPHNRRTRKVQKKHSRGFF
jgi:hypothetical protein